MAYAKGGYPTELASKVGHIKLIQDPMVQKLIESFENHQPAADKEFPDVSGVVDLAAESGITQVVTIDGGHQAVPNLVRPERQVGFVQVAVQLVKLETIEYLRQHPMADPRDVQKAFGRFTDHILAALPVVGVHLPGCSLRQSLRESIHRFIRHYELYPGFAYLVYRQWEPHPATASPSMECYSCGESFELPRNEITFACPSCQHSHWLSDYLGLCDRDSDERSTEETVSNFRVALEALALFGIIVKFLEREPLMARTLFLLDGPLTLRAQLSRLVEPIRALIADRKAQGCSLHLVGVEKNGDFRGFADAYAAKLVRDGEFFIPSVQYVLESINGRVFDPGSYRNRVNYGAKVVARLGADHVLALNVPTGEFMMEPKWGDLIGLDAILQTLSRLRSYAYENALIPVVLANSAASISNRPSAGLLTQFVDSLLGAAHG